jgi:hypothetical protein
MQNVWKRLEIDHVYWLVLKGCELAILTNVLAFRFSCTVLSHDFELGYIDTSR